MTLSTAEGTWIKSSCWCALKDEEELPEPSISLGVPHVNTPKGGSFFTQTTYPCDICGPNLKGLLDVEEHQGTHTALITIHAGHVRNSSG